MSQNQKHDTAYVQDSIFASGYVANQRPALLSYVAASGGFTSPNPGAEFAYLELGCSSGVTLNALAAASPQAQFVGVDFIADHVAQAQDLAKAAGLENVVYHQADFRDFAQLKLPQFDYIATNGTYSWLDPAAEDAVHTIVDSHLKANGIFFVDYMLMPGKAPIAPMWHLMRKLTETGYEDSAQRARDGFSYLSTLVQNNAQYFQNNAHAKEVFKFWENRLKAGPAGAEYLAHATLTDHWCPKYTSDVFEALAPLGLQFAGSTSLQMNDVELSLPADLRPDAESGLGPVHVEMMKDFYHYTQQRQDVFVRADALGNQDEVLLSADLHLAFTWPQGTPQWTFKDPTNAPVQTDMKMTGRIGELITQGNTGIGDIAATLTSEGSTPGDIASTIKRMLCAPELDVYARAPNRGGPAAITGVDASNRYNALTVDKLKREGGTLFLVSDCMGGCVELPALVSTIVAAFVGQTAASVTLDKTLTFVRSVPGSYETGRGQRLDGKDVTSQMIAPAYDLAIKVVLPGLLAMGALKPL